MDLVSAMRPGQREANRYAQVVTALAYWNAIVASNGPQAAPGVGAGGSGATLPTATYLCAFTYVTPSGETIPSATASQAITLGQVLTITPTAPAVPAGATGWNCYCGTATPLQLQNATPLVAASLAINAPLASLGAWPIASGALMIAAAFGSIAQSQPSFEGLVNAQAAVTYLTNELARIANPAGYTGPNYLY